MRNGWYMSTNDLVHYVEDDHYICNGAIKLTPLHREKKDRMIDNLTCQRCARKKI